jgi:hypothetical protein
MLLTHLTDVQDSCQTSHYCQRFPDTMAGTERTKEKPASAGALAGRFARIREIPLRVIPQHLTEGEKMLLTQLTHLQYSCQKLCIGAKY